MADRRKVLQVALLVVGIASLLVYPLMLVWPAGWSWQPGQHEYEQMIVGIYATLGVFLIRAARAPEEHGSLIWFTVWSSVVHGGIMAAQAFVDPAERGHLLGDVPALFLIAIVLGSLAPRRTTVAAVCRSRANLSSNCRAKVSARVVCLGGGRSSKGVRAGHQVRGPLVSGSGK